MITCEIRYTIDPHQLAEFEQYVARWPEIIERCGGNLIGYFLPGDGANNEAMALLDFESLSDYEQFRGRLAADDDALKNKEYARQTKCVLVESRTFYRRAA
jgi:uncharacterized protein (DUF1330 family)